MATKFVIKNLSKKKDRAKMQIVKNRISPLFILKFTKNSIKSVKKHAKNVIIWLKTFLCLIFAKTRVLMSNKIPHEKPLKSIAIKMMGWERVSYSIYLNNLFSKFVFSAFCIYFTEENFPVKQTCLLSRSSFVTSMFEPAITTEQSPISTTACVLVDEITFVAPVKDNFFLSSMQILSTFSSFLFAKNHE